MPSSQVTLSVENSFKRSITYSFEDDSTFQDRFMDHAQKHEFADITWFPSQYQVAYRIDDRVPVKASGDGVNDFIGFQSNLAAISKAIRSTGEQRPYLLSLKFGRMNDLGFSTV